MKKPYSWMLILFLSGCIIKSFAQENFEPGYVVLQSGDTLHGLVDDRQWLNSPASFNFKDTRTGNVTVYDPSTAKYFFTSAKSELYVAVKTGFVTRVPIDRISSEGVQKEFSGFMRALVLGEMDLYQLVDASTEYYFIRHRDQQVEELTLRRITKSSADNGQPLGGRYIGYLPIYKNTLHNKITDCPDLKKDVEKLEFEQKDLTKFVNDYNNCIGKGGRVVAASEPATKVSYGLAAGGHLGKITTLDSQGNEVAVSEIGPAFGGFIIFYHPRLHRRFGLYTELLARSFSASTVEDVSTFLNKNITTSYKLNFLKLSAAFRITLPGEDTRVFIQPGYMLSAPLSSSIQQTIKQSSLPETTNEFEVKGERGWFAGAGVRHKKVEVELRFESTGGVGNSPTLENDSGTNIYLLLKYVFAK